MSDVDRLMGVCVLQVHGLWQRFLGPSGSSIRQLHARIFYDNLDYDHILGWAPHRAKKPPCYSEYLKVCRFRLISGRGGWTCETNPTHMFRPFRQFPAP